MPTRIPSVTNESAVSPAELLMQFDSVQQTLILESWISLDYATQMRAREEVVDEAVSSLAADGVLRDILLMEKQPREAFLCHARREIAKCLITRFGVV